MSIKYDYCPEKVNKEKIEFTTMILDKCYEMIKYWNTVLDNDPNVDATLDPVRPLYFFYRNIYHTAIKSLNVHELAYIRDMRIDNSLRFSEHKPDKNDEYFIENAFTNLNQDVTYVPLFQEVINEFKELSKEDKDAWLLKFRSKYEKAIGSRQE